MMRKKFYPLRRGKYEFKTIQPCVPVTGNPIASTGDLQVCDRTARRSRTMFACGRLGDFAIKRFKHS